MPLPTRILVPTDFSSQAGQALSYAAALAKQIPKAEITLMHAIEPMVFPSPDKADAAKWKQKIEGQLKDLAKKTKAGAKFGVKTVVRSGRSHQEIVRAAKDCDSDLIVMGSAGYTASSYAMFGTTAERVARKAGCPVLLVREKGRELK